MCPQQARLDRPAFRSMIVIGKAEVVICIIAEILIGRLLKESEIRFVFHVHGVGGGRVIADVKRSQSGGGEADEDVETANGEDRPSRRIFFCRRPEASLLT